MFVQAITLASLALGAAAQSATASASMTAAGEAQTTITGIVVRLSTSWTSPGDKS